MQEPSAPPVSEERVSDSAMTALTLAYSAPMPGLGSRYADGPVAHEVRLLTAMPAAQALAAAARQAVGQTILDAALGSARVAGYADVRAAAYLAPLARAALTGSSSGRVLAALGHHEIQPFLRAFETSAGIGADAPSDGSLAVSLRVALDSGTDATLRDAMRFAAARDALAREYARDYEVTGDLARPALLATLGRAESSRAALVQSYLEVLAEVPDLDVARRAGTREAEDVSRMAKGVLKAGGVRSRRGLQAVINLDGILREDPRLAPSATEPPVMAAAFLVSLEYGASALSQRLGPVSGSDRGR
ncbi:MAG TPA: triphosphoribosyl-dephospho-CoA synthase [Rubrobacteraceae bacterium]|nr:triphosphoribosyl-dephospho-CoA synthase [Rubrobacteraceae bacterium]